MNSAIELHDSKVESVTHADERITCHFSAVYIHKSEGRPGVDAGTGWIQAAQLTFEDAAISGKLPDLPEVVWHGDFRINGKDQRGLIPIPLANSSEVEMDLQFDELHLACIRGKRPSLILLGQPKYVEEFKPANSPPTGKV